MMRIPMTLTTLLVMGSALAGAQMTAREIVDHVDRIMRGESSHGIATMEVVTENWERTMTVEIWSRGTEFSLIRITAPKKEEGTATLMAHDEIWNYLPRVDRTIKIPASMMSGAWMGSHFTNDDLVKESRLIEDYEISIGFDGTRDGVAVWELELVPRPEAAVVWGRIVYQVRQDDMMPTWARYFDEDGTLVRTMLFHDYRRMGGRLVPAVMDVRPEDKPGERTTVRYESLEFDVGLQEDFFSLRALRSGAR